MVSDTPRTDARTFGCDRTVIRDVVDIARTLERELVAMTAQRDGYAKRCAELESQLRQAMRGAL